MIVETIFILLAPAGLFYSWYFYWTKMKAEPAGWRNRISIFTLALISLVALLWVVMAALMPKANWGNGSGIDRQMQYIEAWHKPIFRTCALALLLCLFGRPRLIMPIGVACVGIAIFWLASTAP